MTDDGVPSEEQLDRIRAGVMRRIDLRRTIARRVAGGVTAAVLVFGGVGLIASLPQMVGTSGSAGGGQAAGSRAESEPMVKVTCSLGGADDGTRKAVSVPEAQLPGAALSACGGQQFAMPSTTSGGAAAPDDTTDGTASALTLCIDVDGGYTVLRVTGTADATCTKAGMTSYRP